MITIFLLIFLTGLCKGIMDAVSFNHSHPWIEGRTWWDTSISWKNKYMDSIPYVVFHTDAWHFFSSIRIWAGIVCIWLLMDDIIPTGQIFIEGEFLGYSIPNWANMLTDLITMRLIYWFGFVIPYKLTED